MGRERYGYFVAETLSIRRRMAEGLDESLDDLNHEAEPPARDEEICTAVFVDAFKYCYELIRLIRRERRGAWRRDQIYANSLWLLPSDCLLFRCPTSRFSVYEQNGMSP